MGGKRKADNLRLKSIWDESLLSPIMQNEQHRSKLWKWLIQHPTTVMDDIPFDKWNLPRNAIQFVKENFVVYTSKIVDKHESIRGDTVKLLIELQDGHQVETVIMRHPAHSTVCVSSQIGCQMGCRFCATGTMGIIGDLTRGEILEQLAYANSVSKIRNVVFMGMGEPLNNYDNVRDAVLFIIDTKLFSLSPKHVTVSTVGIINNMIRLSNEIPSISLALSLHAPNQEVRLKIVPTASAYKIEKLMDAIDHHIKNNSNYLKNSRRDTEGSSFFTPRPSRLTCVMIEYILIKDLNDKESHAHELGKLLKPRRENVLLNLIPYNPTEVAEDYEPPTQASIDNFKGICTSSEYQIHTRVRQEKGQDIAGACGQLALVKVDKLKAHDIEDTGIVHKSSKAFVEGKNGHVRRSFGFTKPALLCGLNLLVPMLVVLYKALVRVDAPTVN